MESLPHWNMVIVVVVVVIINDDHNIQNNLFQKLKFFHLKRQKNQKSNNGIETITNLYTRGSKFQRRSHTTKEVSIKGTRAFRYKFL
jgi:hypothetical protein